MELFSGQKLDKDAADRLNSLQLAYLGDTVWELDVRQMLTCRALNVKHMHRECVQYVNAQAQASFLETIQGSLTEQETEIVRRGRNAHAHHPAPKNQKPGDYSSATAFEALIGYLYLTGRQDRIEEIFQTIIGGDNHG